MPSLLPAPLLHTIEQHLSSLPGTHHLRPLLLLTPPRRCPPPFPFSHSRPRTFSQSILLLLFAYDPALVCVAAIQGFVYIFPTIDSCIIYIEKVDSSGLGPTRPSPTRTLVHAILSHLLHPSTRPAANVWAYLFARSQPQYIFPNSSENPRKRVLGDKELCRWWRRVWEDVLLELSLPAGEADAYYLLPGYSELEALSLLGPAREGVRWTYGPALTSPLYPSPTPEGPTLALLVPVFEDDPKARFVQELAAGGAAGHVLPPTKKKAKLTSAPPSPVKPTRGEESASPRKHVEKERETPEERALAHTSVEEFWELMPYRQECLSGAVTGFFTVVVRPSSSASPAVPLPDPFTDEPLHPPPTFASSSHPAPPPTDAHSSHASDPLPDPSHIPPSSLARIATSLSELDFGSVPNAQGHGQGEGRTEGDADGQERGRRASLVLGALVGGMCGAPAGWMGSSEPGTSAGDTVNGELGEKGMWESISVEIRVSNPPLPARHDSGAGHTHANGAAGSGSGAHQAGGEAAKVNVLQVRRKRKAPS